MNAQTKLLEAWKALNIDNYAIQFESIIHKNSTQVTRGVATGEIRENAKTKLSQSSFMGDVPKVWNKAPMNLKQSKTLSSVKKEIKTYVKSLPI